MNKSILITGGLGFIGFHLSEYLIAQYPASQITVIDNLSSTKLNFDSITHRASVRIADMRTLAASNEQFDEIYHLASPVGSVGILEKNGYIASDIVELAHVAADIAKRNQAKLLYLSSSEVYGRDGQHNESVELVVPPTRGARMEYSLGKLTAEHVLFNRALDDSFELRVVRPFNVAGEWQSAHLGFVLPKFFEAALTNRPLTVYGNGQQQRAFCHVSDLVRGTVSIQETAPANEIYNLGNPNNITTIENLAKKIKQSCKSQSDIQFVDPYKIHGPRFIEAFDKIPDISKVITTTSWGPSIGFDETLRRIQHFYLASKNIQRTHPEVVPLV